MLKLKGHNLQCLFFFGTFLKTQFDTYGNYYFTINMHLMHIFMYLVVQNQIEGFEKSLV